MIPAWRRGRARLFAPVITTPPVRLLPTDAHRQAEIDRACLHELGLCTGSMPGWWKPVEIRGRQGKPPRQVYRWVWL